MTGKILISIFDSIPLWVMILPIAICSVVALAVVIERSIFYHSIKRDYRHIMNKVSIAFKSDNLEEAKSICSNNEGRINVMINNILIKWNDPIEKEMLVLDESEKTIRLIEKFGGTLSTIATISPMLGLLGTVTGMMKSFSSLSSLGPSAQDLLAQGITEALITTALGLMVAIPSMMFYNFMVSKSDLFIREIEYIATSFLDIWNIYSKKINMDPLKKR